jgi:hypothetical protein
LIARKDVNEKMGLPLTLAWLEDMLCISFGSLDPKSKCYATLKKLKQENKPMDECAREFETTVHEMGSDINSDEMIERFKDGMNPSM